MSSRCVHTGSRLRETTLSSLGTARRWNQRRRNHGANKLFGPLSSRLFRVRDVFAVLQPPLFGNVWRAVDPVAKAVTFSPWKLLVEIPRTLAVTFAMARLLTTLEANDAKSAAKLALWLWFGFSALMWVGAVTWEQNPWQVAARPFRRLPAEDCAHRP